MNFVLCFEQMIVKALPDEPVNVPTNPSSQRLLIEGVQKLELLAQASVKAEAEALYK